MVSLKVEISVQESPDAWRASWYVNERLVDQPISVNGQEARNILELGRQFLDLFQDTGRPLTDAPTLQAFGRLLFERWFQPVWPSIEPQLASGPRDLLICSKD